MFIEENTKKLASDIEGSILNLSEMLKTQNFKIIDLKKNSVSKTQLINLMEE
jgi:hypothetical protein